MADYYARLGIARDATADEINRSYRHLSRSAHPDRGGNEEQHRALQEARDTLCDEDLRREYDLSIGQRPRAFGVQLLLDDGSMYGRILQVLERVHAFDLHPPTIIVIGDESHGKSSLMERITMREYFGTGRGFCTKVPVRTVLRKVAEDDHSKDFVYLRRPGRPAIEFPPDRASPDRILERINRIYADEGLDNDDRVLADEELVIEVRATDVPNLDVVDLPGIVQRAELHEATLAITRRYLSVPHTLVICVIDGSIDSAANNSAALRECSALADQTVVAVTKVDRRPFSEARTCFRELHEGIRHSLPAIDGAHIIPVINRVSDPPKPTLHASIQLEQQEFARWREEEADQPVGIDGGVGIEDLLRALDGMLQRYVRTVWVEAELSRVDTELAAVHDRLAPLGKPPEQCTPEEVLAALREALRTSLASDRFEEPTLEAWEWVREMLPAQPAQATTTRLARSSLRADFEQRWVAACNALAGQANTLIATLVDDAFDGGSFPPMRLQRFALLRAHVLQTATSLFGTEHFTVESTENRQLYSAMLMRGKNVLHGTLRASFPQLFDPSPLVRELVDIAFDAVLLPVVRHDFAVTAEELVEDEQTARERERLQRRRADVLAAKQAVEELFDTVAPYTAPEGGGGSPAGGLFGAAPAATPAAAPAAPAGGLFGAAPATTRAAAPTAPPPGFNFGTAPPWAPAPGFSFGTAPPAAGGFGAPAASPFGAPAPAPASTFGAPAPASTFGAPAPAPPPGGFNFDFGGGPRGRGRRRESHGRDGRRGGRGR